MFKFNSVPAYSIGKARPKNQDETFPGPGAYDTSKLIDIKEKHVGTTVVYKPSKSKPNMKLNDVGPGAYDINIKNHVKGFYNGKSKGDRNIAKGNDVPGPGQYNYDQVILKLTKANGVVFDRSKKETGTNSLPLGPGQYATEKYTMFEGKNKAWSFNKARNSAKYDKDVPGPGTYDYSKSFELRKGGAGFSLPRAPKTNRNDSKTPGPGMYNNNVGALTSKGYHFPKSQEKINNENLPGPGHYNPSVDKLKTKAPGFKFDKNDKVDKLENIPGPGQYDNRITALTSKGSKFNKSRRYKNIQTEVPPPGQYDVRPIDKAPGVVFDKCPVRLQQVNTNPGPGQYDYQEKHKIKFALPKATIKDGPNEVPGPGHYDTKFDDWNKRVPAFDKTSRLGKENAIHLGPGHYNIPHSIPDVPRYNYPDVQQRKIHI